MGGVHPHRQNDTPLESKYAVRSAWPEIAFLCREAEELEAAQTPVEPLDVIITERDTLLPLGTITAVLGDRIVIQVGIPPKLTSVPCAFERSIPSQKSKLTVVLGAALNAPIAYHQPEIQLAQEILKHSCAHSPLFLHTACMQTCYTATLFWPALPSFTEMRPPKY